MNKDLLKLYERMLYIREAENLIRHEYASNSIKTPVHLAIGAEAIPCGILPHFPQRRVFGTYRNHHWYLETTNDLRGFFLELLGKQSAPCQGRAGSMHLCDPKKGFVLSSAVVSTTLPIALGDSWAGQIKKEKHQTIVFFGDGATEEGVFFETLNYASLKNIPILFVCEDNELAIHSVKKNRQAFAIEKLVKSVDISYIFSTSHKIEDVHSVANKARSLLQKGPVFLHLEYFRALEHVGVSEDYHFKYRQKPEDIWTQKDPLWNCRVQLLRDGYLEEVVVKFERKIKEEVLSIYNDCLEEQDADPLFVDKHLFAESKSE